MGFWRPASKTQRESFNHGLSTTGVIFTMLLLIVVGLVGYLQWGSAAAGSAPTTDSIADAHADIDSLQFDSVLSLSAQLDPQAIEARDDSEMLQQLLRYVPANKPSRSIPKNIETQLHIGGDLSFGTSSVSTSATTLRLGVGVDELQDIFAADFRQFAKQSFLRVQQLPETAELPTEAVVGQWFTIDRSDTPSLPQLPAVGQNIAGQIIGQEDLPPQAVRKLTQSAISTGLITITNKTKTELRSGAPAWQLNLAIEPQTAATFHREAEDILASGTSIESNQNDFSNVTADQLKQQLQQLQDRVDNIRVWIARKPHRIRRIVINSDSSDDDSEETKEPQMDGITGLSAELDISFSGYNEPQQETRPADAKPFGSLFGTSTATN